MTSTLKIRLYLILVALLPAAAVFAVLYIHISTEAENQIRLEMMSQVNTGRLLINQQGELVRQNLQRLGAERSVRSVLLRIRDGSLRTGDRLETAASGLDFVELLDAGNTVISSSHRSGLIGQIMETAPEQNPAQQPARLSVEYDRNGQHAALVGRVELADGYSLSGGQYLHPPLIAAWHEISGAEFEMVFADDSTVDLTPYHQMQPAELYDHNNRFVSVIAGSAEAGLYLLILPSATDRSDLLSSLVQIAGLVGLITFALAVVLGLYITGRSRREISNLVEATSRVAAGDLSTPVMAYEEGEFSILADSFSNMMTNLRESTRKLAASEKIAAWQMVGRKIAHEIKNPLTPIAISTDDIRRSYQEKLPGFENTLMQNTAMIKAEIKRLTQLLDEFVSFARMRPPERLNVSLDQLLGDIAALYRPQVEAGRLAMQNRSGRKEIFVDPDQFRQLLLNLIKNGLETGDDSHVTVLVDDKDGQILIELSDDGPGFPKEMLDNRFEPQLSTKEGGSGLGLVICQRIVLDHGGSIELQNRPEGGATVRMVIP